MTLEPRRRCMCIPTLDDAKEKAARFRRQHGPALVAVRISKNATRPTATYSCAYTFRESRTEELF